MLAVIIILLLVVLGAGAVLIIGLRVRGKVFSGAARDAWERARRDLTSGDRLQVRRATMRRRPVDDAALAPAQLVYSRYAEYAAERSPLRRWPGLTVMTVIYGGNAALQVVSAVTETRQRALHLVLGVAFAALTVTCVPLIPLSLRRQPARMRQLRAQVRERYPGAGA